MPVMQEVINAADRQNFLFASGFDLFLPLDMEGSVNKMKKRTKIYAVYLICYFRGGIPPPFLRELTLHLMH